MLYPIGVKTTNDKYPEDATDDSLYVWGDETLDGNAPEEYVDANDDGMFNAGVASQSSSTSELFSDSGDVPILMLIQWLSQLLSNCRKTLQ